MSPSGDLVKEHKGQDINQSRLAAGIGAKDAERCDAAGRERFQIDALSLAVSKEVVPFHTQDFPSGGRSCSCGKRFETFGTKRLKNRFRYFCHGRTAAERRQVFL